MKINTVTLWSKGRTSFSDVQLTKQESQSEFADDIYLDKVADWVAGLDSDDQDKLRLAIATYYWSSRDLAKMLVSDPCLREDLEALDFID